MTAAAATFLSESALNHLLNKVSNLFHIFSERSTPICIYLKLFIVLDSLYVLIDTCQILFTLLYLLLQVSLLLYSGLAIVLS